MGLFGPKIGLTLKPNDLTEFRMSYGKAYNTPTITALHTNLIFGRWGEYFTMILKGNRDGTPYARADNLGKYGEYGYAIDLVDPFYYKPEADGTYTKVPFDSGNLDDCVSSYSNSCDSYTDRIQGAPLFYNTGDSGYPIDYIPLDTLNHIIYIPSAYGDGVYYTPAQSVRLPDVDPLRSESMQTIEFGFKSFLTERMLVSMDIYFTEYNNFFSPATFITPLVRDRYTDEIIGLIPANLDGTNPPYATAWDGKDNDNDFSGMGYYVTQDQVSCVDEFGIPSPSIGYPCGFNQETGEYYLDYEDLAEQIDGASLQDWAEIFGWNDDKDGDGNPQDPGEWGYVDRLDETDDGYYIYTVITPDQIWGNHIGEITQPISDGNFIAYDNVDTRWLDVGVDEYSTRIGGHYEGEILDEETGQIGFPSKLPIITLSSLNYGNVHHAGMDIGLTYFFSEKFIMDFNFTHFNSTAYYNELTKKYDPINSPKFKFNIAANINTNKLGSVLLKWRHVDKFEWADGTWAGTIGPYNIIDIHYNYEISKNLKFGITATNLFNDMHRELVGGAEMGRQVIMRLTTTFN